MEYNFLDQIGLNQFFEKLKSMFAFKSDLTNLKGEKGDKGDKGDPQTPSSILPKANGTADAGSSSDYARGDHVHPLQTDIPGNAASANYIKPVIISASTDFNFDTMLTPGIYNVFTASDGVIRTGIPEGNVNGTLVVISYGGSYHKVKQIWFRSGTTNKNDWMTHIRSISSTVVGTWKRIVMCPEDLTAIGSDILPVYLTSSGTVEACKNTLETSVPADAVFTDTTYSDMQGASASTAGKSGLVPAPASGTQSKFLRGDGTWAVPPNTDTKNTAGSTASSSKLFLIGAASQTSSAKTYSCNATYIGTDGCLYSNNTRVISEITLSTEPSIQKTGDYWLQEYT